MEYVLVSLRLSLVRYGFVEVWGVFPQALLYCTENVAGIHACIRGRGQESLDPPLNRRNIVFHCNAGPVKSNLQDRIKTASSKVRCTVQVNV